jgi:hypothetical protein
VESGACRHSTDEDASYHGHAEVARFLSEFEAESLKKSPTVGSNSPT